MCVANSARSQLAEGLARKFYPNAEINSAGSHPDCLNPFAVKVMSEIGIDISAHFSKSVHDLPATFIEKLNYIITLCDEEVCPILQSKAVKLHWPINDPASREPLTDEVQLSRFRIARDAIHVRLKESKLS